MSRAVRPLLFSLLLSALALIGLGQIGARPTVKERVAAVLNASGDESLRPAGSDVARLQDAPARVPERLLARRAAVRRHGRDVGAPGDQALTLGSRAAGLTIDRIAGRSLWHHQRPTSLSAFAVSAPTRAPPSAF